MSPCMKRYVHAIHKVFYVMLGLLPLFCAVLDIKTMEFKAESNHVEGLTKADFENVHITVY